MGYRSDVAYTIRFKEKEDFALFIAEAKAQEYGQALEECLVDDKRLQINLLATDVKWYSSYEFVKYHSAIIDQARSWCEEADHVEVSQTNELTADLRRYKLGCIFVRVGEDTDDVEEDCHGDYDWDWLRVTRSVVADWD